MATIVGSRSPLYWKKTPGAPAVILDAGRFSGNIFYVDSNGGGTDSAGFGMEPDAAFLTIDFAIGQCTANQGDVILVLPGHSETISAAAGIDLDVAGVSIIGLGKGPDRPTIAMSATASTFEIAGNGCSIENLLFTTSAAVTIMVDVNATDVRIEGCEFRMGTAISCIDLDGGSANACDRAQILNNICDASDDGPDEFVHLPEVQDSVVIDGNFAYGLFDDAAIHNPSGSVCTWLRITNNILVNTTAASHSIELVSACTGVIANNRCGSPLADATPGDIDGGSCHILENYSHDAGGNDSGLLNPTADA